VSAGGRGAAEGPGAANDRRRSLVSEREAILGHEGVPVAAFQARSERSPDNHRIEACPRVAAFLARYLYSPQTQDVYLDRGPRSRPSTDEIGRKFGDRLSGDEGSVLPLRRRQKSPQVAGLAVDTKRYGGV
jgi:hypothetical protein